MSNDNTPDFIQKLFDKIDTLTAIITSQTDSINKLTDTVATLSIENAALKEQLNKNSKNSSKPPSSDGFKKPSPKSLRKPTGKKQGAQEGHEGKGLSITQVPDEIIQHIPSKCIGCLNVGTCTSCGITDTRYEVDIRVDSKVIAH